MKYCKFCGTQLDDDAVCTCEEAQKELNEKQTEARAYETDDDKKADLAAGEMKLPSDMEVPSKNQSDFSLLACDIRTFAFIGVGSVIAITIIVMIISAIVGGGYKKPLNDLKKGLNKGDFDIFAEAFPEDIADDMDDNDGLVTALTLLKMSTEKILNSSIRLTTRRKFLTESLKRLRTFRI